MVTSQEMNESEMGYRGSKSKYNGIVQNYFVKEQRVDGGWFSLALQEGQ